MRIAIVLFVSGFTGLTLTRCKSVPPKTEKAIEISESLDSDIDKSDATPEQKSGMKKKNSDVRTIVTDQGKTLTTQATEINRLKWYEDIFWQIVMAAGGVLIGAIVSWVILRR